MKLVLLDFRFFIYISYIFLLSIFHQHIRMGGGRSEILFPTQVLHVQ